MAIEDKTVPYEILIRFGEDGIPRGAHILRRRVITIDGEIVKNDVGVAEPISLEGFPTSAIMSDALRDALQSVGDLNAKNDALQKALSAATAATESAPAKA